MDGAKKNPVAATATGVVEGPYTGLGNGQEEIVSSAEMAAIRALDRKVTDGFNLVHGQFAVLRSERQEDREEFRDFRRQHREDFGELKRELKTDIARVDARAEQRTKELEVRFNERLTEVDARAERRARELEARFNERLTEVDTRAEQRTKELEVRFNERLTEVDTRAEQRTKELEVRLTERLADVDARVERRFAAVEVRLDRLEHALLDLTALVNKSLERSSGTRRLAWGVLGAAGLLLAGGLMRPLFERAVAALVGG